MTDLILSIDDYNPGNIELAKLIKSYGLESNTIFFIDLGLSVWEETPSEPNEAMKQIKELDSLGFKIGSHNLTHDNSLKEAPYEVQKRQIFKSKEIIEDITGKPCKHYCYNRGRSSEQIRQLVKEAGYEDARGTKVLCTEQPKDKFNMETTVHAFERDEYNGIDWLRIAKEYIDSFQPRYFQEKGLMHAPATGYPQCFHFWLHYKEISRSGEMDKFKEILKYIKSNL